MIEQALVQRGYPGRDAAAIATFIIAALRGLLIDLVANRDRGRLDEAMEILALVTRTMEAMGPLAAREILPDRAARKRKRALRRRVGTER